MNLRDLAKFVNDSLAMGVDPETEVNVADGRYRHPLTMGSVDGDGAVSLHAVPDPSMRGGISL